MYRAKKNATYFLFALLLSGFISISCLSDYEEATQETSLVEYLKSCEENYYKPGPPYGSGD